MTAHMLGLRDEYIPNSWETAFTQYDQIMTPALGPTPENVELARILLDLIQEVDGGLTRPALHAFTRYLVGDQIADWIQIPEEPVWEPMIRAGWPLLVAFREGAMPWPGVPHVMWAFEEAIRRFALWYLAGGERISIEMPTTNRPY